MLPTTSEAANNALLAMIQGEAESFRDFAINDSVNGLRAGDHVGDAVIAKPKPRRETVIEFIRSARHSLRLSVFRCDDLTILRELGEAAWRGVRVEALMTGRAKGWSGRLDALAGCLTRMGVVVHRFSNQDMKYHAKFIVADDQASLVGTLNLTRKCFQRTRDFILVSRDPRLVAGLLALFRADVQGRAAPRAGRLVIGPENSRQQIEELLKSAKESIRILDHKLSDPRILAILRERRRRGVQIEIHSGDAGDSLVPHGRLIIVDHSVAVLGSLSLSQPSLDARRELAVILQQPDLIAKLERHFEKAAPQQKLEAAA
jgi:phosphatidylserine/phosphatidylglycerophosphate/cardiolipin synthase-like enzyme